MTKREAPGARETGYPGDPERPMDAAGPGEAGDETPPTEARAASLLDRWQAHHDGQADADDQTDHAAAAGTPGTDDGEPAVEVTASPASPDLPDLPDLHQPAPSVADHVPEPDPAPAVPRISDLAEARARRAGPVEPEPEAVEPTPLRPAAAPSPEAVPEAVSEPEPEPAPDAQPDARPVAEVTPEPAAQHPAAQDPAPRSVPRAGPDSGEIPVLGPDAEEPAPSPAALAKPSSGVRRPKHAAPRRAPLPSDRATDSVSASREVMDALAAGRDSDPAPDKPAPKHLARVRLTGREEDEADAAAGVPGATTGRRRGRERAPGPQSAAGVRTGPQVGPSLNVEFEPKIAARRVIGLLLLVALIVTAGAAYLAYEDPRPLTLGAAGTLLAVTLVLYAVRAGSTPTLVAIRSGQLEVTRGKTHEVFDLTSRFTRIEVVGKPGGRGWKVLFGRFGRDPLVINSSIVDPKKFTAELERYRWRRP